MSVGKINIAILGRGVGAEFIPIYQRHPQANLCAICQRTKEKLDQIGECFGVEKRYSDFDELLKDPQVEAGHSGSHPHLAQEFIMALVENREPMPNARQSSNWTRVGLCAHQPALKGGAIVRLPGFTQ